MYEKTRFTRARRRHQQRAKGAPLGLLHKQAANITTFRPKKRLTSGSTQSTTKNAMGPAPPPPLPPPLPSPGKPPCLLKPVPPRPSSQTRSNQRVKSYASYTHGSAASLFFVSYLCVGLPTPHLYAFDICCDLPTLMIDSTYSGKRQEWQRGGGGREGGRGRLSMLTQVNN